MPVTLPFYAVLSRQEVRNLPCPKCSADSGANCLDDDGVESDKNHTARTQLAIEQSLITIDDQGYLLNSAGNVVASVAGALTSRGVTIVWDYGASTSELPTASERNPRERSESPPSPSSRRSGTTPRARVWDHYDRIILKPRGMDRRLEAKRARIIDKALAVRTVERCCEAIDGLNASAHHNGVNDRRKKYLDIRYALAGIRKEGDDERVDKMAEKAPKPDRASKAQAGAGLMSVGEFVDALPAVVGENVWTLVRNVERMMRSPEHATLLSIGQQSERELTDRFRVEVVLTDESGRVYARPVLRRLEER